MTFLKQKSNINSQAATKLIDGGLYSPSVHCSYYSCFQLMLHILQTDFKLSESDIKKETKGKGSHNWVIGRIKLKLLSDRDIGRKFDRCIGALKAKRNRSDYYNCKIKIQEANLASDLSKSVKHEILRFFN